MLISIVLCHPISEILLSTKPEKRGPGSIGQVNLPSRQLQLLLGECFHLTAREIQMPDKIAIEIQLIISGDLSHYKTTLPSSQRFKSLSSGIVIVGGMHWRFFSLLRSPGICPWLLVPLSALQDLHVHCLLLTVRVQLFRLQG